MLGRHRNRVAEVYLNGMCLVEALRSCKFNRTPFYLRNLLRAVFG